MPQVWPRSPAKGRWACLPPGLEAPGGRFTLFSPSVVISPPCLSLHSSALQTCGPGDEEHASPSRESHCGAMISSSLDGLGPLPVLRPARKGPFAWVSCLEVNVGLLPSPNLCPAVPLPPPLLRMQDLPEGAGRQK